MLERPPPRRKKTANATRVAESKARAVAGRAKISPDVPTEEIQQLLTDNGFMDPSEWVDWDLATVAERRQARTVWSRGVSQMVDLLIRLEMHFPRDFKK
jgi:hypothetical protein